MIKVTPIVNLNDRAILALVDRTNTRALIRAGAYIQKTARRNIKFSPFPSRPGHPPHTAYGDLKSAIRYAVDKPTSTLVVGTAKSFFSIVGGVHEFGGTYMDRKYPARPFMGPAFQRALPRVASFWTNVVR